jgi:DNA repair protein RadC
MKNVINQTVCFEIQAKYKRMAKIERFHIASSIEAEAYVRNIKEMKALIPFKEVAIMLLLDRANNVIGHQVNGVGLIASCQVNVREAVLLALKSNASGVIFVHNHPSGNTKPSLSDLTITRKLREGLELFDITLVDAIIITEDNFVSINI